MPLRVRDKYQEFGIILLQDDTGDKVTLIKDNCRGEGEKITLEILGKWVRGGGMSVTWQSLVTALRKCELLLLADQIEMALKKR